MLLFYKLLIFAFFLVLFYAWFRYGERGRSRGFSQVAQTLNLEFDPLDQPGARQTGDEVTRRLLEGLDQLPRIRDSDPVLAWFSLTGEIDGLQVRAFDYGFRPHQAQSFWTNGENATVSLVVVEPSRLAAPVFQVTRPYSVQALAAGKTLPSERAITVDSPEFQRQFVVAGADADELKRFFNRDRCGQLLSSLADVTSPVAVECDGQRLLVYEPWTRAKPGQVQTLVMAAIALGKAWTAEAGG